MTAAVLPVTSVSKQVLSRLGYHRRYDAHTLWHHIIASGQHCETSTSIITTLAYHPFQKIQRGREYGRCHCSSRVLTPAVVVAAMALVSSGATLSDEGSCVMAVTSCETSRIDDDDDQTNLASLDLASVGVNEADVDALVQNLLKDENVNISMLPDRLEAQLYKSTILLTLNAVYTVIQNLQGCRLLSHELSISVDRDPTQPSRLSKALVEGAGECVNDEVLEQVVKRLLKNSAVNAGWLPDELEFQIYYACLQVMFRVTRIVLSTFRVKICGHELQLLLTCNGDGDGFLESAALDALSSGDGVSREHRITPIDLDLLNSIARQAGIDDESNPDYWWNRVFTRSDFVRQLHVSLYGLVLGLLDDMFLGHLNIQILSDTINFDLVPAEKSYSSQGERDRGNSEAESALETIEPTSMAPKGVSVASFAAASFAAGVGVGVTLMAALSKSQR